MNRDLYSNTEFTDLKEKLNQEILRRGTYKWWDPLTTPAVGEDRSSPLSLPDVGQQVLVDEKTYTINTPSEESIEPTRNVMYPAHGESLSGHIPDRNKAIPNTSAAQVNVDEMRNFLVGLAKIKDINLFYGRDEISHLAYRDPKGIEDVLIEAQNSKLNDLLHESDISPSKNDPNGGITDHKNPDYPVKHEVTYPMEDGKYVMPSGEYNGEELLKHEGIGVQNFYDDYGAKPGDSNFHPFNRYTSPLVRRDWDDQGNNRDDIPTKIFEGGLSSVRFGTNPRNPNQGDPYTSRPVYGGKEGACNVACTGLCFQTCDNQCSESCSTTCWNRCGNACTSTCGNVCTGCSTMCYMSCKTKCENSTGYSCLKAGAKAVKISTSGGKNGEPAKNTLTYETYACQGCSFSCQFYPNKKTECWDAGCMGKCFTSCDTSCSTSCYGGCIDNASNDKSSYKTGKGRGCSGGCTLNCIGLCSGVCEGYCVQTCWHACKASCSDNCAWKCSTNCSAGCDRGCTNGCTGCSSTCTGECIGQAVSRECVGCGSIGGCTSSCQFDCNKNCMGWGCRSICGIDTAGSCEANCRLNCSGTSCTAMCSDACSQQCSTCVNTCGFQCGACSSQCSVGCGSACNINCTENCSNSCTDNCVHSCSEECGGCSNLCYSCIGMCIGVCSVKCEDGCSSCANTCGWWCDTSCGRDCFADCVSRCINSCSGSCSTFLHSETTMTIGPERKPTATGYIYPNPVNRWQERESFRLFRDPAPNTLKTNDDYKKLITIMTEKNSKYIILEMNSADEDVLIQQVWNVNRENDEVMSYDTNIDTIDTEDILDVWKYFKGEFVQIRFERVFEKDYVYIWDVSKFGRFDPDKHSNHFNGERNLVVVGPKELEYTTKQTVLYGGVFTINESTSEVIVDTDMLPGIINTNKPNIDDGDGVFIVILYHNRNIDVQDNDINVIVPFGFESYKPIHDKDNNIIIIIERDEFLSHEEEMEENDG